MNIQLAHFRIDADEPFPKLPTERAYAVVVIAHDETPDHYRYAAAEAMATGGCVMASYWGVQAREWEEMTEAAHALALVAEERSEDFPDLLATCHTTTMIEDVLEFTAAQMQDSEAYELSLLVIVEIGEPAYDPQIMRMAHRSTMHQGMVAAMAC